MFKTFITLAFIFSLTGCERLNCQREFTFVNNTEDTVIVGKVLQDGFGDCEISRWLTVMPNDQVNHSYRGCLKDNFSENNLEFYLVDDNNFNDQQNFYSCDSIEYKNTILKKYSVTFKDLESNDFKIYYP